MSLTLLYPRELIKEAVNGIFVLEFIFWDKSLVLQIKYLPRPSNSFARQPEAMNIVDREWFQAICLQRRVAKSGGDVEWNIKPPNKWSRALDAK